MRGEGNHKIPGSFAPENMEKTGAERVKYSLACQHEDAIPIKFVSYAQKCPTVLCTFAVALRKESVDRNLMMLQSSIKNPVSLSARRAWIEIQTKNRAGTTTHTSLSARRAWIEIASCRRVSGCPLSLSARRAWIEIYTHPIGVLITVIVALRKESVDRNHVRNPTTTLPSVALRKESVDRNA